ncbi:hypothetical protein PGT21_024161 [Puccinia graminis f. sp. tritici]|uniref:Uncharacterized protein n=1 Tax=Puccinia graminis f. sp. tritici TaxID=56615 RepID=A0A5B0MP82_PUCGR|nr:hypothetical protein PGTUg99_011815 [Puccinia graminis f. sp. tritici]KAA1119394.1 hypothetical protein PGT21_024161 [Puccinia graminis f. sp. tritici]
MQFLGISKGPLVVFMLLIVACAANTGRLFECSTYPYCVKKDISVSPMKYTFAPARQTLGALTGTWSCPSVNGNTANACCVHPTGLKDARKHNHPLILNSYQFYNEFKCTEVEGHN